MRWVEVMGDKNASRPSEGECRRSQSWDARAQGSGTGLGAAEVADGLWRLVTPQLDHNPPADSPQGEHRLSAR